MRVLFRQATSFDSIMYSHDVLYICMDVHMYVCITWTCVILMDSVGYKQLELY
jgi:hypothetical protein